MDSFLFLWIFVSKKSCQCDEVTNIERWKLVFFSFFSFPLSPSPSFPFPHSHFLPLQFYIFFLFSTTQFPPFVVLLFFSILILSLSHSLEFGTHAQNTEWRRLFGYVILKISDIVLLLTLRLVISPLLKHGHKFTKRINTNCIVCRGWFPICNVIALTDL